MTNTVKLRASGNDLLDRLPAEEFEVLRPHLQQVSLALRQIVTQYDAEVTHIHFPMTTLVSLLLVLEDDDPVETATVGREGLFGVGAALGVSTSSHRVICQLAGECLRVPVRVFVDAISRCPALSRVVQRYAAFTIRNAGQGIACNALHPVESRACRWLLMIHDQVGRDEFPLTQEFLAFMLGVRRQTVTVVAGSLQGAGLIEYRRGSITVRDRTGLEEGACECYASVKKYYDRIMN